MVDTPVINTFSTLAPIIIQQYESYLPNAFDENLTLLQKVNKIIQSISSTNTTVNSVIEQWNDQIVPYVNGDGFQTDVNNKLDTMASDGTLASLINNDLITSKADITYVDNKVKVTKDNDYLLIGGFSPYDQTLQLLISYDGEKFNRISSSPVFKPSDGNNLRDPSIMFYNNYFYVCYTHNSSVGFGVARSTDLITWEEFSIPVNLGTSPIWAPEWFVDTDGSVYIILSIGDGTTLTDVDGATINNMKIYWMKATNTDLTQFTSPIALNFSTTNSKIDAMIIKKDTTYNMFVKNENTKQIELYTNTSLTNGTWNLLLTLPFTDHVEGPECVLFNGVYYLFADGYRANTSYLSTSTDLVSWSSPIQVGCIDGKYTEHFGVTTLTDDSKKIVDGFSRQNLIDVINRKKDSVNDSLPHYVLENFLSGTSLTLPKRSGYYVANGASPTAITIDNIVVPDYNEQMDIYIVLAVGVGTSNTITIKNANNILLPNDKNYVISASEGNNETIIHLFCPGVAENKFRLVSGVVSEEWQTPTLNNSWVNYGGGYANASYRKRYGRTEIKGLVKSGTGGSKTANVFVLPQGYRPKEDSSFVVITNNGTTSEASMLTIASTGEVYVNGSMANGNGYMYLNLSFPSEQ